MRSFKPPRWHYLLLLSIACIANTECKEYQTARTNYMLQCQGCHQGSGRGMPPVTPDIHEFGQAFMQSERGRAYWISVPGASNSPLSDKALADVLNYMAFELVGVENTQAFTEAEVKVHRATKINDVYQWRAQLITTLTEQRETASD